MALTKRGRKVRTVVRFIFWTALILGALWLIGELTTPDACKGDPAKISQWCKDLRFPK